MIAPIIASISALKFMFDWPIGFGINSSVSRVFLCKMFFEKKIKRSNFRYKQLVDKSGRLRVQFYTKFVKREISRNSVKGMINYSIHYNN